MEIIGDLNTTLVIVSLCDRNHPAYCSRASKMPSASSKTVLTSVLRPMRATEMLDRMEGPRQPLAAAQLAIDRAQRYPLAVHAADLEVIIVMIWSRLWLKVLDRETQSIHQTQSPLYPDM